MPPFLPRKRLRSPSPVSPSHRQAETKPNSRGSNVTPRKTTLFEAIDDSTRSTRSAQSTKKLLENLSRSDDDDDSSSLSSLSSLGDDFEDVPPPKRHRGSEEAVKNEEDDDDNVEFEDVEAPSQLPAPSAMHIYDEENGSGDLDLTLTKETRISITNPHDKKRAPTKIERGIRNATHQMHVQMLMWHNAIRNTWACDREVHLILLRQLGPGVEKEIELWRRSSGIAPKGSPNFTSRKGKGKPNAEKEDRSRDWGSRAHKQSNGGVDMSHGDPLFRLIKALTLFWKSRFRVTEPGLRKIGYMSLQRIDEEIKNFQKEPHNSEAHGERVAGISEFRERARLCEGSRDVGAQLFTALLRAVGLESRLVASLQPVGFSWNASEEATEKKERKLSKTATKSVENDSAEDGSSSDDAIETMAKGRGTGRKTDTRATKKKAGAVNHTKPTTKPLAKKQSKNSGGKESPINLSDEDMDDSASVVDVTPARPRRPVSKVFEKNVPPNYWTEVLSPLTNLWLPCSTLLPDGGAATNESMLAFFQPKGKSSEKLKQVMAYVVGHSSDGTAKDVTVRYLTKHMYPGKTKGFRMAVEKVPVYGKNGKVKRWEEYDWFKTVMSGYERRSTQRTEVDDQEEATDLKVVKPKPKEIKEGEETLASYKASKEYVLERHIKREQALLPNARHVKIFKTKEGEEKVYLRKDLAEVKTRETWHKLGRAPIEDEEPLKLAPYRAMTINRRRELADAQAATGQIPLQGLFSLDQTELIIPPPIENGIIPKNDYGSIDLYLPSMLPAGAVHIPYKGTINVCKKLGINFAEACTGFEFGGRMAIPVITGVVVAEENEDLVLEQWAAFEAERARKEDEKKRVQILGVWRKFLMGLRILKRVREEYGEELDDTVDELNPWTNKNREARIEAEGRKQIMDKQDEEASGGFFPEGHHEEAPLQSHSFFPTRHESDDEDDGGGFVVENDDTGLSTTAADLHVTPTSMPPAAKPVSQAPVDLHFEFQTLDPPSTSKKKRRTPNPRGKATAEATPALPSRPNKKTKSARGSRTQIPMPASKRSRKVAFSSEEEEIDLDDEEPSARSDALSVVDASDAAPEPGHQRTPRSKVRAARGSQPESSPATRSVPRRAAARKSETALKSHYFENSDEDG